ncbi:hypothetical protein KFE25_004371 [Diacronema lutheri]|uniref:BROMI C-terminal Rab TBC-like domain-containing protein n=1 Tax=Diacronema lutheri TaxID=2081491 RepID=A0A8J5X6B4_DIALT|nr:hypothetical protein KFE25_004371 [Diacronema lutheri]
MAAADLDALLELGARLGALGAGLRVGGAPSVEAAASSLHHIAEQLPAVDERAHLLGARACARALAAAALARADAAGGGARAEEEALSAAAAQAHAMVCAALAPPHAAAAWADAAARAACAGGTGDGNGGGDGDDGGGGDDGVGEHADGSGNGDGGAVALRRSDHALDLAADSADATGGAGGVTRPFGACWAELLLASSSGGSLSQLPSMDALPEALGALARAGADAAALGDAWDALAPFSPAELLSVEAWPLVPPALRAVLRAERPLAARGLARVTMGAHALCAKLCARADELAAVELLAALAHAEAQLAAADAADAAAADAASAASAADARDAARWRVARLRLLLRAGAALGEGGGGMHVPQPSARALLAALDEALGANAGVEAAERSADRRAPVRVRALSGAALCALLDPTARCVRALLRVPGWAEMMRDGALLTAAFARAARLAAEPPSPAEPPPAADAPPASLQAAAAAAAVERQGDGGEEGAHDGPRAPAAALCACADAAALCTALHAARLRTLRPHLERAILGAHGAAGGARAAAPLGALAAAALRWLGPAPPGARAGAADCAREEVARLLRELCAEWPLVAPPDADGDVCAALARAVGGAVDGAASAALALAATRRGALALACAPGCVAALSAGCARLAAPGGARHDAICARALARVLGAPRALRAATPDGARRGALCGAFVELAHAARSRRAASALRALVIAVAATADGARALAAAGALRGALALARRGAAGEWASAAAPAHLALAQLAHAADAGDDADRAAIGAAARDVFARAAAPDVAARRLDERAAVDCGYPPQRALARPARRRARAHHPLVEAADATAARDARLCAALALARAPSAARGALRALDDAATAARTAGAPLGEAALLLSGALLAHAPAAVAAPTVAPRLVAALRAEAEADNGAAGRSHAAELCARAAAALELRAAAAIGSPHPLAVRAPLAAPVAQHLPVGDEPFGTALARALPSLPAVAAGGADDELALCTRALGRARVLGAVAAAVDAPPPRAAGDVARAPPPPGLEPDLESGLESGLERAVALLWASAPCARNARLGGGVAVERALLDVAAQLRALDPADVGVEWHGAALLGLCAGRLGGERSPTEWAAAAAALARDVRALRPAGAAWRARGHSAAGGCVDACALCADLVERHLHTELPELHAALARAGVCARALACGWVRCSFAAVLLPRVACAYAVIAPALGAAGPFAFCLALLAHAQERALRLAHAPLELSVALLVDPAAGFDCAAWMPYIASVAARYQHDADEALNAELDEAGHTAP